MFSFLRPAEPNRDINTEVRTDPSRLCTVTPLLLSSVWMLTMTKQWFGLCLDQQNVTKMSSIARYDNVCCCLLWSAADYDTFISSAYALSLVKMSCNYRSWRKCSMLKLDIYSPNSINDFHKRIYSSTSKANIQKDVLLALWLIFHCIFS